MARILLVEDNEMNRESLVRLLRRRSFEVDVALDGAAGLARVASELPDLVLLDMDLPILDGWEVVRRLKADPATRAIPVIALTAHAMSGDRERALQAGCDEYETKPIDIERLTDKMQQLLSG